jgi:hypothetical protein
MRLVCALVGMTACGRTELDGLRAPDAALADASVADGDVDTKLADASRDTHGIDAARTADCQWSFAPPEPYAAGSSPVGIATGDFNGDGYADIITANNPDNSVGLWFNRGDGTFAPQVTYAVGLDPFGLAVGDWNGDGSLDLAIVYEYQATGASQSVDVFLNGGDGTFAPAVPYASADGAFEIVSGDFTGDGRLDLALIDAAGMASVLVNRGDGTFAAPISNGVNLGTWFLAAADFNRDGALDLFEASAFSTIALPGHGDGTFGSPVSYPSSACYEVGAVAAGDLDGDGYPDVAYACFQSHDIVVRINRGDGSFGPEVSCSSPQWPASIVVGDFNGDGKSDLAVANSGVYPNVASLLLNAGDGTFGKPVTYSIDAGASYLADADFNGDGHSDLAVAGNHTVTVLLSQCQ